MFYVQDLFDSLQKEYPQKETEEILKDIKETWKVLSEEDRLEYEIKAD